MNISVGFGLQEVGLWEVGVQGCEEGNKERSEVRGAAAEGVCDGGAHVGECRWEDHTQNGGHHQILPLPRHHCPAKGALSHSFQSNSVHCRRYPISLGHHYASRRSCRQEVRAQNDRYKVTVHAPIIKNHNHIFILLNSAFLFFLFLVRKLTPSIYYIYFILLEQEGGGIGFFFFLILLATDCNYFIYTFSFLLCLYYYIFTSQNKNTIYGPCFCFPIFHYCTLDWGGRVGREISGRTSISFCHQMGVALEIQLFLFVVHKVGIV